MGRIGRLATLLQHEGAGDEGVLIDVHVVHGDVLSRDAGDVVGTRIRNAACEGAMGVSVLGGELHAIGLVFI